MAATAAIFVRHRSLFPPAANGDLQDNALEGTIYALLQGIT